MSAPVESTVKSFSTTFYSIFTLWWKSEQPSTLVFWVTAATDSDPGVRVVDPTTFRPQTNEQSIDGTDPSTGIRFAGTITADWHTATTGKLTGDGMLFVLADGTPFHLTGDIGLWY